MTKLVCIDVDGTLIRSDGSIADRVWPAVERARAAGILLALCSGRPAFGLTPSLAEKLQPGGWHVFQNGASVLHLATGESRSAQLRDDAVAALKEQATRSGAVLELYAETEYVVESRSELASSHAALLGMRFAPRPFDSLDGRIVRAQWIVPHEEAGGFLRAKPDGVTMTGSTSPAMPGISFLNITPEGVDKAPAVRVLADIHGLSLDEVMFVGDGDNDVEALRIVGTPVAMANAAPAARAAARLHVGDVEEGGLAEALALATAGT